MILGFQDLWIAGSRLYFKRDPVGGVDQPVIDFGVIEPVNPQYNITSVKLYDSDGGIKRLLDQATTQIDESYQAKTNNMNLDNLALAFSSTPPATFTQAGTAVTTAVTQKAHLGSLMKVVDPAGNYVWGVASIQGLDNGGALVLGTDYEIVNLERGLVRILTGGTVAENDDVRIDYTPRVISGKRLLHPQNTQGNVRGDCMLVYGRGNNTAQSVRESRAIITPVNFAITADNYSDVELKLDILNDPTQAVPAGRFLAWLGDLPAVS